MRLVAKLGAPEDSSGTLARPSVLFDDPHLNQGGRMLEVLFSKGKRGKIPGLPLEMSGHTLGLRRQPPRMGEDTRSVLEELGYGKLEIEDLIAKGVAIAEKKPDTSGDSE